MSLPSIVQPSGTPVFLAEGHRIEKMPVSADLTMETGEPRKRRVRRSAPRRVPVSLMLSKTQMVDYDEWFETTLRVGAEDFAAPVGNQGPGLLWWRAKWLEKFTVEQLDRNAFRVSGVLILSGQGYTTRVQDGSIALEVTIAIDGSAAVDGDPNIAFEVVVALLEDASLAVELSIPLSSPDYVSTLTPGAASMGLVGETPVLSTQYVPPVVWQFACSDETTPINIGQLIKLPCRQAMRIQTIVFDLNSAQTSGPVFTVDVRKNGSTIFSTYLSFDNGETSSATAATPYALLVPSTTLAYGDIVTVHVTQLGSNDACGLKAALIGSPP